MNNRLHQLLTRMSDLEDEVVVFDRHHLGYLNFFQRFHCAYRAHGGGLLACCSEVGARTGQYFCPIEHARHVRFPELGDADDHEEKLEQFRTDPGRLP